jgi:PAS domain S-box-containing protein
MSFSYEITRTCCCTGGIFGVGDFENVQRDLAFALNDVGNLDEAMCLSVDAALEVSGLDGGGIYVIEEMTGESVLLYAKGVSERFVSKIARLSADDPRTVLMKEARSIYVRPDELSGGKKEGFDEEGLLAVAVIPLIHRGNVIGCLNVASRQHDTIPKKVRPYLEAIAQQCGGVIARMRAEEALRKSEERNRAMLEALPDLMFVFGKNGVYLDYHAADPGLLFVPPEKFLGKSMYDVLPANLAASFKKLVDRLMSTGRLQSLEYPLAISGDMKYFEARMVKCAEANVLAIIRDITGRKRLERALIRSENKYRTLITDAGDAIVVVETDGTIIEVNRAASIILGYPSEDLVSASFLKLHADSEVEAARAYFDMAVEGKPFAPYDSLLVRKDGLCVPTSISLSSIEYNNRRVIQCFIRDVTERKRVEHIKDNVVRDLAHKLKTPLAMAQMSYDSLKDAMETEDSELREKSMRMMENSVTKLRADIDRILDYFRFTMRKAEGPASPVDLERVVGDILKDESIIAQHKPIEFAVEMGDGAREVAVDERDLRTLLSNLVGNAVKFTNEGRIAVSSEIDGSMVRITVVDTGMGVTPEIKERLFERFFQGSAAYPGVGLGLAMCREIVGRYGGRIAIDSPGLGGGTTVTVELPTS